MKTESDLMNFLQMKLESKQIFLFHQVTLLYYYRLLKYSS